MTNKILMGASVLALLAAFPAFAADTKVNANANAEVSTTEKLKADAAAAGDKVEASLDKAGNAIEKTADKATAKTKEAYTDVKAYFSDDDNATVVSSINVNTRLTADELIGTAVQNPKGEKIGSIDDILVDAEGDAETVIINDKGVLGLGGKMAAFDYDIIEGFAKDKDVVVKLTEASIKNAAKFDGDASIPAGQFSVKKIIGSKVVDANGKAVADVQTVAFEGDDADYIIVAFNKILGIGGDKAALNFEALELTNTNGKYTFKLNSQQTAQFQNHKDASKAN